MTGSRPTLTALRAQFPVLARHAYLNAGTNGPLPRAALDAARAELDYEEREGRAGMPYFERLIANLDALRAAYAERLACPPEDVALTTSTTDGVSRALLALDLRPGDEVVTSDEEHPGVLGPLVAQRARGVEVRTVPFDALADAVGPRTTAVVCSHVSWRSGAIAPAALAAIDVPLVLDGAQAVGAVPVDVAELGADFYAGPGQKWLCGSGGTGMLYVSPAARERFPAPSPGYMGLDVPSAGLDARPRADAVAYDTPALPNAAVAQAVAALEVLRLAGWDAILGHAAELAASAAHALRSRGRELLPRGRTTLVTWREPDAERAVERLAAAGVIVRSLPGDDLLRASFGGWNDAGDLARLLDELQRL